MTDSKKPDVVLDQVPSGEVMQERGSSETVRPPLRVTKAKYKTLTTEEQLLQRLTWMTDIWVQHMVMLFSATNLSLSVSTAFRLQSYFP